MDPSQNQNSTDASEGKKENFMVKCNPEMTELNYQGLTMKLEH